jgi:ribulose-phosphate 3-epimerase
MTAHIHPSILSADFANFQSEFATISQADAIHVDVMDGHFVPNLTFGLPVVKRLVEISELPIDVHLMIENVDSLAVKYAETGAESVTFHLEASNNPLKLARELKAAGARAAIAVKPGTNLDFVLDNLSEFDMVLVMTVEPGFGGQAFMDSMMEKVRQARSEITRLGLDVKLQVDGGIDTETVKIASAAGADTFVAGSSIFSKVHRNEEIILLREIADSAYQG